MTYLEFREIELSKLKVGLDALTSYVGNNSDRVAVIYSPGSHSPNQITRWSGIEGAEVLWKGSALPGVLKYIFFFIASRAMAIRVSSEILSEMTIETVDLAYSEVYVVSQSDFDAATKKIGKNWRNPTLVSHAFQEAKSAVILFIDGEGGGPGKVQVAVDASADTEKSLLDPLNASLKDGPIV